MINNGFQVGDPVKVLTAAKGRAAGTIVGFPEAGMVLVRRTNGNVWKYHISRVRYNDNYVK